MHPKGRVAAAAMIGMLSGRRDNRMFRGSCAIVRRMSTNIDSAKLGKLHILRCTCEMFVANMTMVRPDSTALIEASLRARSEGGACVAGAWHMGRSQSC